MIIHSLICYAHAKSYKCFLSTYIGPFLKVTHFYETEKDRKDNPKTKNGPLEGDYHNHRSQSHFISQVKVNFHSTL